MAANRVRMLSSCPAIFRSRAESFAPSSLWSAKVARGRTNARMMATLTAIARPLLRIPRTRDRSGHAKRKNPGLGPGTSPDFGNS